MQRFHVRDLAEIIGSASNYAMDTSILKLYFRNNSVDI